jgi:hypothetical protein
MKTRPATKTARRPSLTTPRAAQGVEVSLYVMLRGLTGLPDARRASRVRLGIDAPETAADYVALAAHAIDVGGEGEVGYAMRNAPVWTREAERLGAAPADVALLRSVFSTLCSRNGVVAA